MFERPHGGERAVLVRLLFDGAEDPQESAEFQQLAAAAGADSVAMVSSITRAEDPVQAIAALQQAIAAGLAMRG